MYVLAVLGDGSWSGGCSILAKGSPESMQCTNETVTVPSGGVVVKVYLWYGAPAVACRGDTEANATFGLNAVRQTAKGDAISWEIRAPGNEFGQTNNIFVEAHTSDAKQLARAQATVTSFLFEPAHDGYPACATDSPEASTPAS